MFFFRFSFIPVLHYSVCFASVPPANLHSVFHFYLKSSVNVGTTCMHLASNFYKIYIFNFRVHNPLFITNQLTNNTVSNFILFHSLIFACHLIYAPFLTYKTTFMCVLVLQLSNLGHYDVLNEY